MQRWGFGTLAILTVVLGLACSNGRALEPGPPAEGGTEERLSIERIEVRVVRAAPPAVFVDVHGILLDGCTFLGAIEQHRDGRVITVTIGTRHTQAENCTMIAKLVDQTIRLEGAFAPGEYTVSVNGVIEKFSV